MKTEILNIKIDREAKIIKRINKYVVSVELDNGNVEEVHLHDPGRLLDIVYSGNRVLLQYKGDNLKRKTAYDIIAGWSNNSWVIIHSIYPNYIVEELLKNHSELIFSQKLESVRREVKNGNSRFDFLVEDELGEIWIEVKGSTYIKDEISKFPDAPTLRGQKHISHLTELVEHGKRCVVIFVITQSTATKFEAYRDIDPKLADLLQKAKQVGVEIKPIVFSFADEIVSFERELKFI